MSLKTDLELLLNRPAAEQYDLAKKLASNCGYKLVEEDNERSLQIKELKNKIDKGYGGLPLEDRELIKQGLERLL